MRNNACVQPVQAALLCVAVFLAAAVPAVSIAPNGRGQGKDQDNNGIVLKTPSGGFEFSDKVKASEIGLRIYPGAKQVTEKDKDNGSLRFNLSRQGKSDAHFLVAKFESTDPVEQVRDFYKKRLGHRITKFKEKDKDGNMVFEMRKGDQQRRYVQIKSGNGGTEIDLVRIEGVSFADENDN